MISNGEQYNLISKRLKSSQIQQIMETLGLPTVSLTTEARQMIQEKLDYEPLDIQMIIHDTDDDASILSVNDTDIIKTIECNKVVSHANDSTSQSPIHTVHRWMRDMFSMNQTVMADLVT